MKRWILVLGGAAIVVLIAVIVIIAGGEEPVPAKESPAAAEAPTVTKPPTVAVTPPTTAPEKDSEEKEVPEVKEKEQEPSKEMGLTIANSIPLGTTYSAKDVQTLGGDKLGFELTVLDVQLGSDLSAFGTKSTKRDLKITVRLKIIGEPEESANLWTTDFIVYGSEGETYDSLNSPSGTYLAGTEKTMTLTFRVSVDGTSFTLKWRPGDGKVKRFFALE